MSGISPQLAAALMGGQAQPAGPGGMSPGKPQGAQPPMPQGGPPGGQLPPEVASALMMGTAPPQGGPMGGPSKPQGGQPPPPLGSLPAAMGTLPGGAVGQQLTNASQPWYAIPGIQGGKPPMPVAAAAPAQDPAAVEQARLMALAKLFPPADPWATSPGGGSEGNGEGGGGGVEVGGF